MPQQQYLSTDPNAGTPVKASGGYLSTDPSAGTPVKAVDPNEPSTYGAGFVKGLKEGVVGGAKGFVQGLAQAPGALVQGAANMLTQSPEMQALQLVQGVTQIPAAVRAAATPAGAEQWGKDVGTLTGTTELGLAGPELIGAGARVASRAGLTASDLVPPAVKSAIPPAIPKLIQAVQKYRASAPEAAAASPNAGGTLVAAQEPSLNEVIGNALDELRKAEPPRRVTTPPQPSLPPGYTPRSTVPAPQVASPSGMASMQAAAPAPAAPSVASATPAAPTRPYFLKPEAETPTPTPAAPQPDLPQAWQQFTKPASFPPKEIEGSGLAAAFLQELTKRGMQASEAIPMVLRNKALDAATRSQLVTALEKVARAQAGVLQ